MPRVIEAAGCEVVPALLLEDVPVRLVVPQDLELLALGIVVGAGEAHDRRGAVELGHLLDEPAARTDMDELADVGLAGRTSAGMEPRV